MNKDDLATVRETKGQFCIKACWVCPCLWWGQKIIISCAGIARQLSVMDTGAGYYGDEANIDLPDQTFEEMGGKGRMVCRVYTRTTRGNAGGTD